MEKIKSIIELSEIIAKDISGKSSPKERERLEEWLNTSEQNRKEYTRILESCNLEEPDNRYAHVDVEKAWNHVERAISPMGKTRSLYKIARYAAAILIPVLMGITAYWYVNDPLLAPQQTVEQIQPGTRSAVLVMADGKNVNLKDNETKNLVENDGTLINNNNEELSYLDQSIHKTDQALLNTLIVPKGGEYSLVLSDGTRVYVNSMSKLEFPVRFTGDKREITLEGEAYFKVAPDKTKPFIVHVKGVQVEVLGTSFNIKAYADDVHSFTTLMEGKVKLNPSHDASRVCFLEPNQQAAFNPTTSGIDVQRVDAAQVVQWITGKYSFSNKSLDEIMKTLSRWYDFDYRYENESLKELRFEGGLNKYENIEPILEIIKRTGKVNVTIKGKEVLFSRIE